MTTKRGPDYADQLTEVERRTLDELLDAARTVRRSRRAAILSAAAATLLLGGLATSIHAGLRGTEQAPASTDAIATLTQLATAASNTSPVAFAMPDVLFEAGPPLPGGTGPRLHTVEVIVTKQCRADAVEIDVRVDPAAPAGGRLRIYAVTLPADATLATCRKLTAEPPQPALDTTTADLAGTWAQARDRFAALGGYVDPGWVTGAATAGGRAVAELPATPRGIQELLDAAAAIAGRSTVDIGGAVERWRWLVAALVSPDLSPAQHGAALGWVAATGEVTVVSDGPPTLAGRRGVTLRVPYPAPAANGAPGWADLTFDPRTGVLLQRSVTGTDGVTVVTVYRR